MLANGTHEGYPEQSAHPEVNDRGGQQPGRPTLQNTQADRFVVKTLSLNTVDRNDLLTGADAFSNVVLKILDENVGHPAGNLVGIFKQVHHGRADEVNAAGWRHI